MSPLTRRARCDGLELASSTRQRVPAQRLRPLFFVYDLKGSRYPKSNRGYSRNPGDAGTKSSDLNVLVLEKGCIGWRLGGAHGQHGKGETSPIGFYRHH